MSILNEKTEETSKKIHLMVTNLCSRHCPNCCNKCYSLDDIPLVTENELKDCETLFLTGGEPFEFCNVDALAKYYKEHYPNIENVIVYGNVKEFAGYLFLANGTLNYVDGVSLSIKDKEDLDTWNRFARDFMHHSGKIKNLIHNRLYYFIDVEIIVADRFPKYKENG